MEERVEEAHCTTLRQSQWQCCPLTAPGWALQALPLLNDDVVEKMRAPVHALLAHLDMTLGANVEALSDGNRDRMFTAASQLLQKASQVLTHADGTVAADSKVSPAMGSLGLNPAQLLSLAPIMHMAPSPRTAS